METLVFFSIFVLNVFKFYSQGPATCVAFSRTGDFFASGGSDEQVGDWFPFIVMFVCCCCCFLCYCLFVLSILLLSEREPMLESNNKYFLTEEALMVG